MILRFVAWVGPAVYLVGLVASIVLGDTLLKDLEGVSFTAAFGAFPLVGLAILLKRPGNPLGWVFWTIGLFGGIGLFSWSYSEYSYYVAEEPLAFARVVAWMGSWFWYPLIGSIVILPLLLFPDGLLSRRWRPVLWVAIGTLAFVTSVAATPETFVAGEDDGDRVLLRLDGPIGLHDTPQVEELAVFEWSWFVLLGLVVLGVVSLVQRFRRSRGRERLQMKWFTYAAAIMFVNLAIGSFIPAFDESFFSTLVFVIAIAALPISCGVAIVRHQLYDIDVIVNRTLVYGVLTGLLVLAYLGVVFVLQQLLSGITQDSDLAVAGSTLTVATMFRPLRSRVQAFIDRRFYRKKYDARQTLESFTSRLRDDVDLHHLARDLSNVVRETMQPSHVSVWLRGSEGARL